MEVKGEVPPFPPYQCPNYLPTTLVAYVQQLPDSVNMVVVYYSGRGCWEEQRTGSDKPGLGHMEGGVYKGSRTFKSERTGVNNTRLNVKGCTKRGTSFF